MASEGGCLVVIGLGLKAACHITLESYEHLRAAERAYYVAADSLMGAWVMSVNQSAISLNHLYRRGKPRIDTYREMADVITAAVTEGHRVCAAFYGHPGVLVQAAHDAVTRVKKLGLPATMLPGISAEACLFADLGINPGDSGCQTFEATDFLAFRRRFDPYRPLILYQVGVLGERSIHYANPSRRALRALARKLARRYSQDHEVIYYTAATLPGSPPTIRQVPLTSLEEVAISPAVTVYVPPLPSKPGKPFVSWIPGRARPAESS